MAPLDLEGKNLGEKHRNYNRLLCEALKDNREPQPIVYTGGDHIQNLINIDIACKTRNVDYILEVLKCEHDLYFSKAIKQSTWLITDPKYAHIVNPEYLFKELHPQLTLKAFNKLMLNVRLKLKDESRVEAFYTYIKENGASAHKWLQNCSIPFIENAIKNGETSNKRLVMKSFDIYEACIRRFGYDSFYHGVNQSDNILIRYPEKLMDYLESSYRHEYYKIGPKGTAFLMQKYPDRILKKIDIYGKYLHVATFAKYLKQSVGIEEFLLQHTDMKNLKWIYQNDKIQHFVKHMPVEKKFEFVRKVFIEKDYPEDSPYQKIAINVTDQRNKRLKNKETYTWYKYAPFDVAYKELIELVRAESLPVTRISMLKCLLSCADRNIDHRRKVLQYFHDNHMNEPFKFKIQFVNQFISSDDTHAYDDEMWDTLIKLFHSMEVFIESENNVQFCVRAVIVRCVIRNEEIPDIIESKFEFDTLKKLQKKLKTQEEKDAVFNYLQNFIVKQSIHLDLEHEPDFDFAVHLCEKNLEIIKDWDRELHDYPNALARIKELAKVKKENGWNRSLTWLYNSKKSWRKLLFEESILIMCDEKSCVNALKHDPDLLSVNESYIKTLSRSDSVSLKNFLRIIRIYWPCTLAEHWTAIYKEGFNQEKGHKALINGLCVLWSQDQINNLLKKYAPSNSNVEWNNRTHIDLSLRKQIAMNIHKARPLPQLDDILLYSKGDHLQYAVPSLNAILSQLNPTKSREYIPRLLNAPISLKKFGIRCAISKLSPEELRPLLSGIWASTKSTALRTVVFTHIYRLLRYRHFKSLSDLFETWELLASFIDTLTPKDNKRVIEKVGEFYFMPEVIQPQFFMKSYKFISSLPARCNSENILGRTIYSAKDFIEHYDDEFFVKIFMNNFEDSIEKNSSKALLIPAYILVGKDEKVQIQRYEKCLHVVLEKYLPEWDKPSEAKDQIKHVLEKFVSDMNIYTFAKRYPIPLHVYERLLQTLEKTLSYKKNYVLLTTWKLIIAFVKTLKENKDIMETYDPKGDEDDNDKELQKMLRVLHEKIAPNYAKIFVQILNEERAQFGNSIWRLLGQALKSCFSDHIGSTLCDSRHRVLYHKHLLECSDDKDIQLIVCQTFQHEIKSYSRLEHERYELFKEMHDILARTATDEVKMHYSELFVGIGLPALI